MPAGGDQIVLVAPRHRDERVGAVRLGSLENIDNGAIAADDRYVEIVGKTGTKGSVTFDQAGGMPVFQQRLGQVVTDLPPPTTMIFIEKASFLLFCCAQRGGAPLTRQRS